MEGTGRKIESSEVSPTEKSLVFVNVAGFLWEIRGGAAGVRKG